MFELSGYAPGEVNIGTDELMFVGSDSPKSCKATIFLTLFVVLFLFVTQTSKRVIWTLDLIKG